MWSYSGLRTISTVAVPHFFLRVSSLIYSWVFILFLGRMFLNQNIGTEYSKRIDGTVGAGWVGWVIGCCGTRQRFHFRTQKIFVRTRGLKKRVRKLLEIIETSLPASSMRFSCWLSTQYCRRMVNNTPEMTCDFENDIVNNTSCFYRYEALLGGTSLALVDTGEFVTFEDPFEVL